MFRHIRIQAAIISIGATPPIIPHPGVDHTRIIELFAAAKKNENKLATFGADRPKREVEIKKGVVHVIESNALTKHRSFHHEPHGERDVSNEAH